MIHGGPARAGARPSRDLMTTMPERA
jgi:hypothetical protein